MNKYLLAARDVADHMFLNRDGLAFAPHPMLVETDRDRYFSAQEAKVYCYNVQPDHFKFSEAGRAKLLVGRARVTSEITCESDVLSFGALHMGYHLMNAGVRVTATAPSVSPDRPR